MVEQVQPPQNNLKGIERFNSQDILRATVTLTQSLEQISPEQTTASDFSHQQDLTLLRQKVSEGKVENDVFIQRGHDRVDFNDPDKLWLALNILYSKRIAENTYLIARSAQLKSLGANIDPTKVSAEQLHQAVLQRMGTEPKLLPYLNSRQVIFGDHATLKLLDSQLLRQTKKPKRAKTRVALAAAAGLAASTVAISHPMEEQVQMPSIDFSHQAAQKEAEPDRSPLTERAASILFPNHEEHRQEILKRHPKLEKAIDLKLNKGRINIVLIGEGAESSAPYADATVTASLDPKKNRLDLISLHRDTYVPEATTYALRKGLPKGKYEIMRALEIGGIPLVEEIVANNTALSPDYYVKFKIGGVVKLIDSVFGKLKINVPADVPDDGSGISFKKGEQYMDGKLAQYYMRSRQTTDVERRMSAQEQVMETLMSAILFKIQNSTSHEREKFLTNLRDVLLELQKIGEIDTNYDLARISRLLDKVNQWSNPATQFLQEQAVKYLYKKPHITKTVFADFADLGKVAGDTGPRDALRAYLDPQTGKLIISKSDSNLVETYYALPRAKTRQVLLSETISAEQKAIPQVDLKQAPELKFPGSAGIVDSNSPIHWDGNTTYAFNSAIIGITRSLGPDLAHLTKDPSQPVVFDNEQLNKFTWLEATYKQGNLLYGWYHHEPPGLFPAGTNRQIKGVDWLSAPRIGAAVSKDNGGSWQDLGFIIDSPPNTFNPETANLYFAGGNGDFSVIPDEKKEYIYIFLTSYHKDPSQQGIAVARMRFEDLNNPKGKVWKWHQGKWEESGPVGSISPIIPAVSNVHKDGANFYWGPSVHFNTYLQSYAMLLNHSKDQDFTQEGVYVSFSPDISNPASWSEPKRVNYTPKNPKDWYPQVVGQGKGESDKRVGQTARLFVKGQSQFEIVFLKPGETLP